MCNLLPIWFIRFELLCERDTYLNTGVDNDAIVKPMSVLTHAIMKFIIIVRYYLLGIYCITLYICMVIY